MFKSLLVALALVAAMPAFADDAFDNVNSPAVDADLRIDFGPGGIGFGWQPGRGPGFGGPGRPGHGPGHGGPGWGRPQMVVCQAMNARGFQFYGRGFDDRRAAGEAMQQCQYSRETLNPRTCRVTGCRYQ